MTIQDGLKLEPKFRIPYYGLRGVEIPDAGRDDLPKFLFESGYRVGVEVGVNQGEFGIKLCQSGLKVYGIDPYIVYPGYKDPESYESHYGEAIANLKGYDYTIIKKFSMDALADFKDESLDFVYIDANHGYESVKEDIAMWWPKVKRGGMLSGHDYAVRPSFGVVQAVNEFLIEHNLSLSYLTVEEHIYDSWAIQKP